MTQIPTPTPDQTDEPGVRQGCRWCDRISASIARHRKIVRISDEQVRRIEACLHAACDIIDAEPYTYYNDLDDPGEPPSFQSEWDDLPGKMVEVEAGEDSHGSLKIRANVMECDDLGRCTAEWDQVFLSAFPAQDETVHARLQTWLRERLQ